MNGEWPTWMGAALLHLRAILHRDNSIELRQLGYKCIENPQVVPAVEAGRCSADETDTVLWQLPHNMTRL